MKRLLKNNHGMTLMEILVALSLLMIIIVGTTPVMLQAYDGLYTAGEYTQDTYEAKSEIEEKLATRNSSNTYPGFIVNFDNLGEVVEVNGRRAVSSMKSSLETLFANSRVKVSVVSSKTVNDDYAGTGYHEVVIQTTNLDFGDDVKNAINEDTKRYLAASKCSLNNQSEIEDGGANNKIIDISFMIPNKQASSDAAVYTYNTGALANLKKNGNDPVYSVNPDTGRITVYINGFDFTQSPIKIFVTYLDENKKKKTTETYLHVETPTIMAVGETTDYHYYTSPGVVTDNSGNETFNVYGRTMRITEFQNTPQTIGINGGTVYISSGVSAIPEGTVFKSINWVDTDTTTGIKPYYVLAGTNGAIYRTYSFSGANTELTSYVNPKDRTIILKDRAGTMVYPALWGGDKSFQFGYSSYFQSVGYNKYTNEDDRCWYTGLATKTDGSFENPVADAYSTKAKFAYYYNGHATAYPHPTKNSRRISYILTEIGNAMRRGGHMASDADFVVDSYDNIWERYSTGTDKAAGQTWNSNGGTNRIFQTCPLYFYGSHQSYDGISKVNDLEAGFAQIRIKYLTTQSPYWFASQKREEENENRADDTNPFSSNVWLNDEGDAYQSNVTVTDAIYIPASTVGGNKVGGEVFYVGTVNANALINQNDAMFASENQADYEKQDDGNWRYAGYRTAYAVFGDGMNGTTVYKASYHEPYYNGSDDAHHYREVDAYYGFFQASSSPIKFSGKTAAEYNSTIYNASESCEVNSETGNKFFVYRKSPGGLHDTMQDALTDMKLTDVYFTMGFASNRTLSFSKVVYGEIDSSNSSAEAYKGCEPLYFKSHWNGDSSHQATLFMSTANGDYITKLNEIETAKKTGKTGAQANEQYFNSVNNDYYNVWFPSEMYNLTKVATKDGVTVSVGYAVAGSAYQFINPNAQSNSSTALGGIYNDGVLSAMVSGQDSSLTNLLYYKDNVSFDGTSLTDGTAGYNYTDYNGDSFERVTGYTPPEYILGGLIQTKPEQWTKDTEGRTDYGLFATKGYGTHTRNSVQFTAVDIGVHEESDGTTAYYAYYADNKGRVFRSKVATRTSTAAPQKVNYISDELYTSTTVPKPGVTGYSTNVGYMEQLQPTGTTFATLFDKITTIKCEGKYIIVAGHSNSGVNKWNAAIGEIQDDGTVVFNHVSLDAPDTQTYVVEDVLIQDGYVYFAGVWTADNSGFIYVHPLADMASEAQGDGIIGFADGFFVAVPEDALYAIAGK